MSSNVVLIDDPAVFLNVFHIYAETEMAPWIAEVRHPSLVLTGELDGGCSPRLNQQIADALPNSTYREIPGTHMSAVTKPDLGRAIADALG